MVLPCLMGAFNSIGGSCFGCIKTEAAHLLAYGDNIENLRTQVQNLSAAIKSVKDRIEEAESRGATRVDPVVALLQTKMASLEDEASKIISDEERESDSTCLMGLRPNLRACYLASKSAKKAIDKAVQLLEEEKKLDRPVANVDYSQALAVTPFPDFEEFESRVLVSNQIVAALKDPNLNKVGVYGMGGTGKTTLAEKIGAELQLNGTFSYVVLATISEKQNQLENNYQPDLTSIQKQIAGGLKIQLQGETLNDRATQLREQLEKKDRVLIILDDIWSGFELKDVGIPVGSSVHTKFKILMTSRNKMVLENEMGSTNNFGLDSLPFDDAWNLFDRMVGGESEYSNWRPTAEQVVEQCGGIPILLATIGKALRNANQSVWEEALIQLKQFHGEDFDEEAYKRIEVSYKFLKNEETKKLFLFCAQLDHRSIGFGDLLKYTMGLDLFKERKTLKEVRGRLHKYLRDLKGCCLLQDSNKEGIIKMHDVVHKFATFVASRDHDVFIVPNDGELEEWPSKEQFEKFTAVSFFFCRLPSDHELPVAFDNPKLESFLMARSEMDASFKIPDNFFAGMKGLKLMDLTRMSLSRALVSSLSALVKLRTLCLDGCELGDIAVIGELPMLQALSLIGSSIVYVPKEIGELGSTLKLLDLCDCDELETIASGVISRLTLLEDLRIGKSFMTWEQLQRRSSNNISADEMFSLEEFKNLRNLINLEIHIREHAKMFPKDLVFKKLETFRIFIGSRHRYSDYMLPRTLMVDESSTVVEFDNEGTKALMTRAESLRLTGVKSSVNVSEMDPKGFPELKHLGVNESRDGIQYIVKKNYNNCIFPKLETLNLRYLDKLERICDDHDHLLPVGSFENLRVIDVMRCDLLNDLFSSNLARDLLRLEEIKVWGCESMESIIVSRESENEEEIKIGFTHQLRVLKLDDLPGLLRFYRLKQLEGGVPSRTPLFNKKIVFPKLETLDLVNLNKLERIFDHPLPVGSFENLRVIKVSGCDLLNDLLSSNLARGLLRLKEIKVWSCRRMESIIVSRESENEEEIKIGFTHQLRVLELSSGICGLPGLLSFYRLKQLEGVPSPTPFFNKKIVFPKLEELKLNYMEIEKIWDDHLAIAADGTCWLQNLTSLKVNGCEKLSYLFTFSMVKSFAQLKNLEISYCKSIEEIVATSKGEMEGERLLLFPKLEYLVLHDLPKLEFFSHANSLECPSLQKLEIEGCLLLNAFIGTNNSTPDLKANSTTLFDEKYWIGRRLSWMKIEKIWDDESAISAGRSCWLQNLTGLNVFACGNLSYLFTSSMVKSLAKLKQLRVANCKSIKTIVASTVREVAGEIQLSFPKLDNLMLEDLPNLKRFCHANLQCQLLRDLIIKRCFELKTFISINDSSPDNSTTLFSEKVAFPNMEELEIDGCSSLEKVFDVQILPMNERERCRIPPFQNLRRVRVSECRTLTSIFPTSLVPTLQQLERLEVRKCDKIDLFGFTDTQQLNDAFGKVFPSLKYCYLQRKYMRVVYEHQRSSWELSIDGFQNIIWSPIFFAILKSFPKLDKVVVSSSIATEDDDDMDTLLPCEPDHLAAYMDTLAKTLGRIQHLKLTNLSIREHIWSEHSPLKYHGIPRDPQLLEVVDCHSLLSLAPPSTTLFKNLTALVVQKCPRLKKLIVSSSTAKSLVNLKWMRVLECNSLKEIVVIDDQCDKLASNDEYIVFDKLEVLDLQHLNSLTSFCSTSDCNFRFPSLNRVIVENCPKMKFFSKGALSTPKLKRVWPFWPLGR